MEEVKQEEVTVLELTEEEKNTISAHQALLNRHKLALSDLRIQFLSSERQVLENIGKTQNDFTSHLKVLSQAKNIPQGENWVFDMQDMSFKKRD